MKTVFALAVSSLVVCSVGGASEMRKLWVHPYVCKDGFFGPLRDDYVETLTDASQWETVLVRTDAVGFHVALLGRYHDKATGKTPYRATDEQLRALAAFYRKHNLKVNIEIGGVRFRPNMVRAGRSGVGRRYAREAQIPLLERWRQAGGSIDYLTTDHAVMMRMGEQKAGKTKDGITYSVDELIKELSEALAELHGVFPEAEFGIAESLGHFRVQDPDNGRTYPLRPPDPHGTDLAVFLQKLQSSAAAAGVRIHNFMIDHQIQAAHRDATGKVITVGGPFTLRREYIDRAAEIPVDLGRAAVAAKIARAVGMRVMFLATPGAYGFGQKGDTDAHNNRRAAEAVRRMAKECTAADIRPDAIIFECWQPHPSRTGPETAEHSFMHNVRQSFAQAPAPVAATDRPPNFVFVLADDLGWKDLGCYGSSFHESPHIDRLAAQGMRFTAAYSAAPLCSATRASILSGWAPARQHIHGVTPSEKGQHRWNYHSYQSWTDEPEHQYPKAYPLTIPKVMEQFPLKRTTFAERLKERDYKTGFIGKWHLGPNRDMGPKQQGFDYTFAVSEKGYPPTYHAPYKRGNYEFLDFQAKTSTEYLTDRLTDEAVGFIEKNKDQTFCLYLSHYAVHSPWESRDDYTEHFKGTRKTDAPQNNPVYAGMIKSLDDSVGRLMQTVEKLGLDENTVFVFISDNGARVTSAYGRKPGETNTVTSVAPLRGEKGLIYEGGIRIPFIVRWKGRISGSVSRVPVVSTDLYPTLLELAGLHVKEDNPVDGTSLVPLLAGKGGLDRQHICWFMPHYMKAGEGIRSSAAIRRGNHKLIKFFEGGRALYDLGRDIGEQSDLSTTMPRLADSMEEALMADLKTRNAFFPVKNPKYEEPTAGKTVAAAKPAPKQSAAAVTPNTHVVDFQVANGSLRKKGGLGYTLAADEGEIAWALKPIGIDDNIVRIKSTLRISKNERTANAFLAIGDGTEAKKVLKLGVYYGRKIICIQSVSMPRAAVGTYAEADLTKGSLTPVLIAINQAERSILLDVAGNRLSANFPKQIRRITHVGYANVKSEMECSPLEIEGE